MDPVVDATNSNATSNGAVTNALPGANAGMAIANGVGVVDTTNNNATNNTTMLTASSAATAGASRTNALYPDGAITPNATSLADPNNDANAVFASSLTLLDASSAPYAMSLSSLGPYPRT